MNTGSEVWRSVPGYNGLYEASSLGRVRGRHKGKKQAVLKPWVDSRGRQMVYPSLGGKHRSVFVHAMVAAAFLGPRPPGAQIDHVDCDPTNNRSENLRYCTQSQNLANSRGRRNQTGFKGVARSSAQGRYKAIISHNGDVVRLGLFATAEEAARAYDAKALELWGEFARLNFPNDTALSAVRASAKESK